MTITPATRHLILCRIHDMNEIQAAEELADALGLDRDARELIAAALWEAREDGYNDGKIAAEEDEEQIIKEARAAFRAEAARKKRAAP